MDPVDFSGKFLLDAISSGATLSSIVDPLVSRAVEGDLSPAVAGVLNLCFYVAGAEFDVEEAAFTAEADVPAVLEEVLARVHDGDCVSLLMSKDAKYRRLKKNFNSFFHSVVLAAESLKVPELISTLITWLVHMNESKVRSFRHVALVAACGLTDGLHERLELTSLQGSQGTSRGGRSGTSGRARVDAHLTSIFQHTVHNRIKDVAPEIRVVALQRLRQWYVSHPDRYCVNGYLIYLRFALFDKKPEMRLEALESIGAILCEVPSGLTRITALLTKCSDRLVEMCKDVETRCAHSAIKLCTVLVREDFHFDHTLLDDIFEGLLDDRSIIRNAVGTFLKHFMAVTTRSSGASPFAFVIALLQTLKYQCPTLVEEYLVDALWSNESPPLADVGAEFGTLIGSTDEEESLKGLRCVAALLKRASGGDAALGPSPKDDLYVVSKSKKAAEGREKLLTSFSKMAVDSIEPVLQRFSGSVEVFVAVAALLEHIDLDSCSSSSVKRATKAFRVACRESNFGHEHLGQISASWRKIAFSQHVESSVGELELKEFARDVSRAVEGRSAGSTEDWVKMELVTSVTHVASAWDKFLSSLLSAVGNKDLPRIRSVAGVCFNSIMWAVASDTRDGTCVAAEKAEAFAPILIEFVESVLPTLTDVSVAIAADLVVYSTDLMALPQLILTEGLVRSMVHCAVGLLESFSGRSRHVITAARELGRKLATHVGDNGDLWTEYVPIRAECAVVERACARLASSASRLFLLQKVQPMDGVGLFTVWPVVPKSTADVFKLLFHALRERGGGSGFAFEKAILSAAIDGSDASDIHSLSLVGLLGSKMASIHFAGSDKYYECCPQLVSYALSQCQSQPLWLHATVMYCSKLKQSDALSAYGHAQEIQGLVGDNPYYATFLYAIAKAAKVTDAKPPTKACKRPREGLAVDPDLEILPSSPSASVTQGKPASKGSKRTVDAAGWRVNGSTANLDERTLVATQEWE